MMLAVLVEVKDREGEVVDVFSSFEEAVKAGEQLGGEWRVYVREFSNSGEGKEEQK